MIWSSDDLVGIASPDNLAAVGWNSHLVLRELSRISD
jgi:hypothetical protein